MKTSLAILVAALLLPGLSAARDFSGLQALRDTDYQRIESAVIGRPFHIYTQLPDGYDPDAAASYPTIYLLDGGNLFPMLTAYYRYLQFGEEAPEAIIVGIAYGSDEFEGGNYRATDYTAPSPERDYWGGAGRFQRFLETELLPDIEGRYRADPTRRVLFGQSMGGQFVLYSAQRRPGVFWGYIASNPALHRNLDFFLERPADADDTRERSRMFVASATGDDPIFREPALAWMRHWSAVEKLPWALETCDLIGHSHMSAPPASFRYGLLWLFELTPPAVRSAASSSNTCGSSTFMPRNAAASSSR